MCKVKNVFDGTESISFLRPKRLGPIEFKDLSKLWLFKKAIKNRNWKFLLLTMQDIRPQCQFFVKYVSAFASFLSTHCIYHFSLLGYRYRYYFFFFYYYYYYHYYYYYFFYSQVWCYFLVKNTTTADTNQLP